MPVICQVNLKLLTPNQQEHDPPEADPVLEWPSQGGPEPVTSVGDMKRTEEEDVLSICK